MSTGSVNGLEVYLVLCRWRLARRARQVHGLDLSVTGLYLEQGPANIALDRTLEIVIGIVQHHIVAARNAIDFHGFFL